MATTGRSVAVERRGELRVSSTRADPSAPLDTSAPSGASASWAGPGVADAPPSPDASTAFLVHTADLGASATLRSVATGRYVRTTAGDGETNGVLRADAATADDAASFTLVALGSGRYALRARATGRYVTAPPDGGSGAGVRARADRIGASEAFRLIPIPSPPTDPPAPHPGAHAAVTVSVMSWNACANVSGCPLFRAAPDRIDRAVLAAATDSFSPDVVMLQEFCEKDASRLRRALERATGRGWAVRFAPIGWMVGVTATGEPAEPAEQVPATRLCAPGPEGDDRGAYGIALAVPAAAGWHATYALTSPATDEQRAVLCAAIVSRAVHVCTTHLSSASAGDDPGGAYRVRQVGELLAAVAAPRYRTIFGGDLNLTPPAARSGPVPDALGAAYDSYEECDQSANGGRRTGTPTFGTAKLDYVFGPPEATYRCRVAPRNDDSDHRPIYATVRLPAG